MSQPTPNPPDAAAAAQVAGQSPSSSSPTAELASLKISLRAALRQFPDFPSPGILFEDILPIFANPTLHEALLRSLELHILQNHGNQKPDVIVGLEARGFLIGPSLALRLGASFVPVRKQGKLPGLCATQAYEKEYGQDFFQMQADSIKPGQKVIVVDDIIATGGSAWAAGELIKKMGGELMSFLFILELEFLKGREKLPAPVYTLLSGQEEKH
ncbi:phosphoribosyltransferase-like protein [Aspergillus pseudonomiae]|uniref:adenine phosphoribosyltransferase n=1 Tax=Aspergillus pseudonomiae TaxID=1506151 RepID=A0A5N6I823_9EURO|nr:phosphoribosyltransferase-like protein [Aspergillus pseudonomiae]KAB8262822.1 phosphoribosyltransferase-like protein [Aspergillus pseudonomiae]KAE8399365.1 phosphoribosyltransferase-like protein [Aspergillus pseudonomiae]